MAHKECTRHDDVLLSGIPKSSKAWSLSGCCAGYIRNRVTVGLRRIASDPSTTTLPKCACWHRLRQRLHLILPLPSSSAASVRLHPPSHGRRLKASPRSRRRWRVFPHRAPAPPRTPRCPRPPLDGTMPDLSLNPADLLTTPSTTAPPSHFPSKLNVVAAQSSQKAAKASNAAPRIDLEPLYTNLKAAIAERWSEYKEAVSLFVLGANPSVPPCLPPTMRYMITWHLPLTHTVCAARLAQPVRALRADRPLPGR